MTLKEKIQHNLIISDNTWIPVKVVEDELTGLNIDPSELSDIDNYELYIHFRLKKDGVNSSIYGNGLISNVEKNTKYVLGYNDKEIGKIYFKNGIINLQFTILSTTTKITKSINGTYIDLLEMWKRRCI